jgi:hypothetical protein
MITTNNDQQAILTSFANWKQKENGKRAFDMIWQTSTKFFGRQTYLVVWKNSVTFLTGRKTLDKPNSLFSSVALPCPWFTLTQLQHIIEHKSGPAYTPGYQALLDFIEQLLHRALSGVTLVELESEIYTHLHANWLNLNDTTPPEVVLYHLFDGPNKGTYLAKGPMHHALALEWANRLTMTTGTPHSVEDERAILYEPGSNRVRSNMETRLD